MSSVNRGPSQRADAVRSREKLLAAAADLLGRDSAAPIDTIATHAGVGRTTAFRHFPNREALLSATWAYIVNEADVELAGLRLEQASPSDALDLLIDAVTRLTERWPLLFKGQRPALDDPALSTVFAAPEALIATTVARAAAAGTLRSDLPTAVHVEALLGLVQAVLVAGLRGPAAATAARSLFLTGVGHREG